jgi:hypothetical protein
MAMTQRSNEIKTTDDETSRAGMFMRAKCDGMYTCGQPAPTDLFWICV